MFVSHLVFFLIYECTVFLFTCDGLFSSFATHNISLLLSIIMTNDVFPPSADGRKSFNLPEGKVFTDNRMMFSFFLFVLKTNRTPSDQHTKDYMPSHTYSCKPTLYSRCGYLWTPSNVSPLCHSSLPGALPLRRRMDDEEEDMSRPIPQLWQKPPMDVKYEDRAAQIAAGQALVAVTSAVATSQGHNNNSINTLPCSVRQQPHMPLNGKEVK